MKLKKKVALITGGSRGIGKAIAELFMKEGAEVVITSKNQKQLQQTSKEIGNPFFVAGDVRNENDVKNLSRNADAIVVGSSIIKKVEEPKLKTTKAKKIWCIYW